MEQNFSNPTTDRVKPLRICINLSEYDIQVLINGTHIIMQSNE